MSALGGRSFPVTGMCLHASADVKVQVSPWCHRVWPPRRPSCPFVSPDFRGGSPTPWIRPWPYELDCAHLPHVSPHPEQSRLNSLACAVPACLICALWRDVKAELSEDRAITDTLLATAKRGLPGLLKVLATFPRWSEGRSPPRVAPLCPHTVKPCSRIRHARTPNLQVRPGCFPHA